MIKSIKQRFMFPIIATGAMMLSGCNELPESKLERYMAKKNTNKQS